ncbi:hypothetical protein LPC08_05475 [Roseomonas sp. OT10]|uniref:hypothetical protein n=1 Tax=Roseomonas cutis TaxID=2897332 RepID=UPI001E4FCF37|nr:hypothetical protein [Roseomonas sp. OT10]UFN50084.1 hypothetical protein LPC08_05475 [Roseomonas sp. OT10]
MNRRDALLPLSLLAGAALVSGCAVAQEPWPNLNEAEDHLRLALDALNRAPNRFGGHKGEAERLIRGALAEIEIAKRSFR